MSRLAVFLLLLLLSSTGLSQNGGTSSSPAVDRLSPPDYPQAARNANVSGDVVLNILVHPDGSVESVSVESGAAPLREAALESARQTRFGCRNCGTAPARFQLTYRFVLGPPRDCSVPESGSSSQLPKVSQTANTIVIQDQSPGTCDPAVSLDTVRARSLRCFFLWKCGWRKLER